MKRILLFGLFSTALAWSAQAQRLVPPTGIPDVGTQDHILNAQSVDTTQSNDSYRVHELEETVRQLNGKVEELNFLLLQLQEKVRKMEEDNEGRFQELEEHHSEASDKTREVAQAPAPLEKDSTSGEHSLGKPETSATAVADVKPEPSPEKTTAPTPAPLPAKTPSETPVKAIGPQPRALGTLTFDKDGNVVDGSGNADVVPVIPFNNATVGALEASEFGATPDEVFKVAKIALDGRQYPRAQRAFSAYLAAWPKDPRKGEAQYYLADALFWQKAYFQSAEIHLETHNEFPEADTAAENLLGLGLSLAGLNQREVACATYAEVLKQYPDSADRLAERIKDEQSAARC